MGRVHSPHPDLAQAKQRLRQEMRARRRNLSPEQQQRAAHSLAKHLVRLPAFVRSRHLALYLPNDGEIDPGPLTLAAWRMGKDRKSTRLNSSHVAISYAVFCLKKK